MNNNQKIGKLGEDIATQYLQKLNYQILERNFRTRRGEIDIIARDSATNDIVIVEVKTRRSFNYGYPVEAVNKQKKHHLFLAANYYLYINKIWNVSVRFDVIEVLLKNEKYLINHIKNIEING